MKGFEKAYVAPGKTETVTMALDRRAFSYFNVDIRDWYAEDGAYEIRIGASARDIRLTAKVELTGAKPLPVHVTADTTIGDLMRIPGADKLMAQVMGAMGGAFGGGDTPDLGEGADAMMAAMIEGTPLHSCKSFTGGAFTDEMMNGLIDALNEMQK